MNSIKKLLVATLVVLGIAGCATGKENSSQTRVRVMSSPELITSLGFFLCPYCRLLQRRYGGCLPCDLALVEKSRF